MKTNIEKQVREHFANLVELFPQIANNDPLTFCRKLRRLEARAHKLEEANANGEVKEPVLIVHENQIECEVRDMFNSETFNKIFFINGDPRGYALKLQDDFVRSQTVNIYHDWGGYGILAPEFK